ncbi:hypothetical protein [Paenibacillus curdlanolyticus]|uniref:hypothetical protein n=1 Tax=Paenibacillus curdlanolyticus TaxID=59840 RepID=UPI0002F90E05|nr:hypothetical protein [Paenibacillus curdlanolyticus]
MGLIVAITSEETPQMDMWINTATCEETPQMDAGLINAATSEQTLLTIRFVA